MPRQTVVRSLFLMSLSVLLSHPITAAELDRRQRSIVTNITSSINRAGKLYFEGQFESSGEEIRKALKRVDLAVGTGSPDLYDALVSRLDRISQLHAMVELEGVSLPPFRRPERPSGEPKMADDAPPATPTSGTMVSFTKEVAPILVAKCGRCHVSGNRGGFSAANYAALMKGPAEGVVVFAGDVAGSRLIDTIETGDMPRGGAKVTDQELKLLKDWITQGAKFDGTDPNTMLASSGQAPPANMDAKPLVVGEPTGKESVRFSFDIAPLLVENCSGCHIDAMQVRGGLRMDTFAQFLRGGDSGAIITPGRGEASLLVKKLRGTANDGERMPAGGRPALSEDSIALVSKWIDEGATIDASPTQPIRIISQLAWASQATSEQLSEKRANLADRNFRLSNPSGAIDEYVTDHFRVIGSSSSDTLQLVGRFAEQSVKSAKSIARAKSGSSPEDYFRGRATIFVLPKRYDYSEFAKMVESRSVPASWSSHWQHDGIDAYAVTVATESEEDEAIETRLLAPIVSLAVATRGVDVPRWFSEGLGSAQAIKQNAKARGEADQMRTLATQAASSVKDAKAFLGNKLTPEQSDSFGAAVCHSMLDRNRKKSLDAVFRQLSLGKPFDEAFFGGFGVTPTVYIDQFLQYVR